MKIGSLFSGIGGLELGLERAGIGPVLWQCEIDPFCRRVLAQHWPSARRYEDVREVDGSAEWVDVICGGFPCTDLSLAGKGAGLDGDASGLWFEMLRVVRLVRPRVVVVENVPALLLRGMGVVLGGLAESGYDAQWDCVPAQAVGAPHRRDRLFLVAWRVSDPLRHPLRFEPERGGGSTRSTDAGNMGEEVADPDEKRRGEGRSRKGSRGRAGSRSRGQALADADGERGAEPQPRQQSTRQARERAHLAGDAASSVADADGGGWGEERGVGLFDRERTSRGDHAHRRDVSHTWPPAPDDMHAWGGLPVEAQPAICRATHGVPRGVDRRRLKVLGNAVVSQVGEVIGRAIMDSLARPGART